MLQGDEVGGGATEVYPDGGRSIWFLGMLITFKALGEETGGEYSLYEQTVPPQLGVPPHIHHSETEAFYVLEGEFEFLKDHGDSPRVRHRNAASTGSVTVAERKAGACRRDGAITSWTGEVWGCPSTSPAVEPGTDVCCRLLRTFGCRQLRLSVRALLFLG